MDRLIDRLIDEWILGSWVFISIAKDNQQPNKTKLYELVGSMRKRLQYYKNNAMN